MLFAAAAAGVPGVSAAPPLLQSCRGSHRAAAPKMQRARDTPPCLHYPSPLYLPGQGHLLLLHADYCHCVEALAHYPLPAAAVVPAAVAAAYREASQR